MKREWAKQRGASLVLIAGSLVMLLAMAGLAIDLGALYVARSEAQRAADAAALAGAQEIVDSTFPTGGVSQAVAETMAAQQAAQIGNQNLVAEQSPNISPTAAASCPPPANEVCFDFSNPLNPRTTAVVQATAPTFFMKIFGVLSANVSATATAEAYAGGGPPIGTSCLKPWMLPNCDYTKPTSDPTKANSLCPPVSGGGGATTYPSYFVKCSNLNGPSTCTVLNPGPASSGGVVGEAITIKPGNPSAAPAPSQFYPVSFLPVGAGPAAALSCPACTNASDPYRQNIECCNSFPVRCGPSRVSPITGDKTGPTALGVDCLIHESPQNGTGEDTINLRGGGGDGDCSIASGGLFAACAGANNPLVVGGVIGVGKTVSSSSSIVTLPIYDGSALCPGKSCPNGVSINVLGFIQLFIKDETNPQGTVQAYILNITTCGGGSGTVFGAVSPAPVRLIHN